MEQQPLGADLLERAFKAARPFLMREWPEGLEKFEAQLRLAVTLDRGDRGSQETRIKAASARAPAHVRSILSIMIQATESVSAMRMFELLMGYMSGGLESATGEMMAQSAAADVEGDPRAFTRAMRSATTRSAPPRAAARSTAPEPPGPAGRVTNVWITSPDGERLGNDRTLAAGSEYRLHLDIGPRSVESVVSNPAPVRSDLLPPAEEGHWLDVGVASLQLDVESRLQRIFLPATGQAWVCDCARDAPHRCTPEQRVAFLAVPFRTGPGSRKHAQLRITLYHRRHIVQSLLLTAKVTETSRRGAYAARVDYNLSDALVDVAELPERQLSIMMNAGGDSHTLTFNGLPDRTVSFPLSERQNSGALEAARAALLDIHLTPDRQTRLNSANGKTRLEFIDDLRGLADRGWTLFNALWGGERLDFWIEHRTALGAASQQIQVARQENTTYTFPWALVYDIERDSGNAASLRECALLSADNWNQFAAGTDDTLYRCPHENTHAAGTLCPFGFWGFRYDIEQPPSLPPERPRASVIPGSPRPLDMVVAVSEDLDTVLRDTHTGDLGRIAGCAVRLVRDRDRVAEELGREVPLVYFYCHGTEVTLPGSAAAIPGLGVGKKTDAIVPQNITAWRMGWPREHWRTSRPLVVINGCHTVAIRPDTMVQFVDTFTRALWASGVVGTEITVDQRVANEAGLTFMQEFLGGATIAKALRLVRTRMLRKCSLLGLAYTAFAPMDVRLA